jgi:starch-binding outer membrane protein, SusD/RagB family
MSHILGRANRRARGAVMGSGSRVVATALGLVIGGAAVTGCYNFNISDPNGPTLNGLTSNPTLISVDAAMTGAFAEARAPMTGLIWFVGSMGREGINLSGNNQPDYSEPYYGPLSSQGDGSGEWSGQYAAIRDADIVIDAAPHAVGMSSAQADLAMGVAQFEKALMFLQVVSTRATYGAPVDMDHPANATPAPFVREDSVYATILHTLDSALVNLQNGSSAGFTFTLPPGYAIAGTPATFRQLVWALEAKALCFRASAAITDASTGGGGSRAAAPGYYAAALRAIDSSFYSAAAVGPNGPVVSFDYSPAANDVTNELSDPITGPTFFADTFNITDAQKQTGGAPDLRVTNKITSIENVGDTTPQILGGIPQIPGWLKFTIYLNDGAVNTSAPIPLIKDTELALLKAEAEIGTGDLADAVTDLNNVRENDGGLAAYSGPLTAAALTTELLYNRRYSLLWEQGARWIDARRFGQLGTIELGWVASAYPDFPPPSVPTRMPVPALECEARGLGAVCSPLGT